MANASYAGGLPLPPQVAMNHASMPLTDHTSDQILRPYLVRDPTKLSIQPMAAGENSMAAKSKNFHSLTNGRFQ